MLSTPWCGIGAVGALIVRRLPMTVGWHRPEAAGAPA